MKGVNNYPIGDFLSSLKNIALARGRVMEYKNIKLVKEVALCLERLGYLEKLENDPKSGIIRVFLRYAHKLPVISDIKLISRPGLRVYWNLRTLKSYKKPQILIISTPKGILSSKEALKEGVGGEVIASVW